MAWDSAVSSSGDSVQRQYEALPYPARDPAAERQRLIVGSPSHLLEIEHYILGGRRASALRVLVAGGGTGDGAIMLAQQLADRNDGGEVRYLDLSVASLEIAQARAQIRGLDNITFEQASLLDLDPARDGPFDYIDCCGVLHHLADPAAGLAALARVLAPGGGIGLLLYAPYGRTGVYPLQQAMRRLFPADLPVAERLAGGRSLYDALPETNWLNRNPFIADHLHSDDAGFYDLLLHSRDRAFTVTEIDELARDAGLNISGFVEPARYQPSLYLQNPDLLARAAALPWLEQCALAEELGGNLKTHVCYLGKDSRAADPGDMENVPVLREMTPGAFADAVARQPVIRADFDGLSYRRRLPEHAADILRLCTGEFSLADIRRRLAIAPEVFAAAFAETYDALSTLNLLLLAGRRE